MKVKKIVYNPDKKGVFRMSTVQNPAIKSGLVLFSDQQPTDLKGVFYAPAMIPDLNIQRYDEVTNEPYLVYYDADTVEQLAYNYLKQGGNLGSNIEHQEENQDGLYPVESWIVKDPLNDKSAALGMPQKAGTWMMGFKCEDDGVLQQIKDKLLNGLSIEGQVDYEDDINNPISKFNKQSFMNKTPLEKAKALLNVVMSAIIDEKPTEEMAATTPVGTAKPAEGSPEEEKNETPAEEKVEDPTGDESENLQAELDTAKATIEQLMQENADLKAQIAKYENDATLMSEQIEKVSSEFEKYKTTKMSSQKLGDLPKPKAEPIVGENDKHTAFLKETMSKLV